MRLASIVSNKSCSFWQVFADARGRDMKPETPKVVLITGASGYLGQHLLVALSSAQQPERSRNQKTSSVEDDLGLERRPFDDSLKHSSAPGKTTDKNRINEDLLDYHDIYRDHPHDHEHLEEGDKVVHWEL